MFVAEIERIDNGLVRPVWPASWEIDHRVSSIRESYHKRVAEKGARVTVPEAMSVPGSLLGMDMSSYILVSMFALRKTLDGGAFHLHY